MIRIKLSLLKKCIIIVSEITFDLILISVALLIICDDLIFWFWKTKLLSLLTSIHLHLESKSTAVFDTLLLDADIARQTRIAKMFKRALVSMLETTKIIYCQSYNSPCRNEEIFN